LYIVQPPRPDAPQRKRPKDTRYKTGCLTCRAKKSRCCDEIKPSCVRCIHGQPEVRGPRRAFANTKKKLMCVPLCSVHGRKACPTPRLAGDLSTTTSNPPPRLIPP
ncbi:hypothetical protein K474DRAFT_1592428, partial [Panus rudis PR-1116 ss-1]